MLRRSSLFVSLVAVTTGVSLGLACNEATTPGNAADGSTSDSASAPDEGIAPRPDAGDASEPVTDHQGNVFAVSESVTAPSAASNYRAGAFFAIGAKSTDDVVATTTFGTCVAETIKPRDGADGTDVSAGKLTISGGSKTIEITPKSDNTYTPSSSSAQTLFSGGEQLTAKVEGAGVPAFQTTLTAPSKLVVTAPLLAADAGPDSTLDMTRASGLGITWTGTSSGTFVAYFATTSPNEVHTLTCRYAPSAGSAQIPKEALATLFAGEGFFDMYVEEKSKPTVKDWAVSFTVTTNTNSATGAGMTGTARIK